MRARDALWAKKFDDGRFYYFPDQDKNTSVSYML